MLLHCVFAMSKLFIIIPKILLLLMVVVLVVATTMAGVVHGFSGGGIVVDDDDDSTDENFVVGGSSSGGIVPWRITTLDDDDGDYGYYYSSSSSSSSSSISRSNNNNNDADTHLHHENTIPIIITGVDETTDESGYYYYNSITTVVADAGETTTAAAASLISSLLFPNEYDDDINNNTSSSSSSISSSDVNNNNDNNNNNPTPLMLDSAGVVSCSAGSYLPAGSAICILCETGTYYYNSGAQPAAAALVSCTLCPPGMYGAGVGATQCVPCPAGSFSYFAGSSVCSVCPPWTGSSPGMSECVTCSSSVGGCLYSGTPTRNCPRCDSACTLCRPGYYSDGTSSAACVACGAGTYSVDSGAVSSVQCQKCAKGTYTKVFSSGMTACLSCDSGLAKPKNTVYVDSTDLAFDPLLCKWVCVNGFKAMPGAAADSPQWNSYYASFTSASQQYSPGQAGELIDLRTAYCCDVSKVDTGMFLDGCDKSNVGTVLDCNPILNGYYIHGPNSDELSRCGYWVCSDGYYKLYDQCIEQPVCDDGYTYRRTRDGLYDPEFATADGLEIVFPGRYVCVPCPVCVDGSETLVSCNRISSPVCRMCGGNAPYSANGGPCVENVPYGFRAVKIFLTAPPAWGAQPVTFYDGVPFAWNAQLKFSSYIKCSDAGGGDGRSYTGNDEECNPGTSSQCDVCETQCAQWKRSGGWFQGDGWFAGSGGQCQKCVYDSARCADYGEYLDMSVCGPINQPACAAFNGVMGTGQENWANPRSDYSYNGMYPCKAVCKKGFMELDGSCIDCTSLPGFPDNAVPIRGCDEWTCPRGFLKSIDNNNLCVACPSSSTCDVGLFPGFSAENNVCLGCMPCVKPINATFVSSGTKEGGVGSCGYKCNANWYTSNKECLQCTQQRTCQAAYFHTPCSATSDSQCVKCRVCADGYSKLQECTASSDAVCVACDPSLLPANTSWVGGSGCRNWTCNANFWLDSSSSSSTAAAAGCIQCKKVCAPSEKMQTIDVCSAATVNTGRCVQCDPLAAGMCFTGDGRCGAALCVNVKKTVSSSSTAVFSKSTSSSSRMPRTTTANALLLKSSTTTTKTIPSTLTTVAVAATPPPPAAFATVAALTMNVAEKITATVLSDLVKSVSKFVCTPEVGIICDVSVLSVTENNQTIICKKGVCPGYTDSSSSSSRRRVLLAASNGPSGIAVGIVTEEAVTDLSTLFDNIGNNVVAYEVMPNAKVVNLTDVRDASKFLDIVSSYFTEYSRRGNIDVVPGGAVVVVVVTAVDNTTTATTVVVVVVFAVAVGFMMKWKRDHNNNNARNNNHNTNNNNAAVATLVNPVTPGAMRLGRQFEGMVGNKKGT